MSNATLPNMSVFLLLLAFLSCNTHTPETQKEHLAGYWEIAQVTFPDGSQKQFALNTTIDFMEVTGTQGTRRKLAPKIDGSFEYFKDAENFELAIENDSLQLYYSTPYATWKETVLEASEEVLIVKNEDQKIYEYKKYQPLSLKDE